MLYTVQVV